MLLLGSLPEITAQVMPAQVDLQMNELPDDIKHSPGKTVDAWICASSTPTANTAETSSLGCVTVVITLNPVEAPLDLYSKLNSMRSACDLSKSLARILDPELSAQPER